MFNNWYAPTESDDDTKDGFENSHVNEYARDFARLIFRQFSVKVVSDNIFYGITAKECYYLNFKFDNNVFKTIQMIATAEGLVINSADSKWISLDGKFKSLIVYILINRQHISFIRQVRSFGRADWDTLLPGVAKLELASETLAARVIL